MANKKIEPQINICQHCGIEFPAGGRGRPKRSAKYHSLRCLALSRIRMPTLKRIPDNLIGYVAGLFDGEGSIILWDRGYGGRPQLRCTISNTYRPIMDWLVTICGSGSIVRKEYPEETGYKIAFTWQLYGQNAVHFLMQLEPFLIIKKDQATKAIESQIPKSNVN